MGKTLPRPWQAPMRVDPLLRRRGVVRRLEGVAGGGKKPGAARVVFAATGCAGCGWRAGGAKTLPVATDLPTGTVVDVAVQPRRLLGQAACVFAPPLAIALGAAAAFGDGALGGLSAVAGLLVGMLAAIAVRRCRSAPRENAWRMTPAVVAAGCRTVVARTVN